MHCSLLPSPGAVASLRGQSLLPGKRKPAPRNVYTHHALDLLLIRKKVDLSPSDFAVMRAMTSWAVCGSRPSSSKEHGSDPVQEEQEGAAAVGRYAALGLNVERREAIGRQCKQIIDRGRVEFLSTWPLEAQLLYYVQPDISPENVLLLAHP